MYLHLALCQQKAFYDHWLEDLPYLNSDHRNHSNKNLVSQALRAAANNDLLLLLLSRHKDRGLYGWANRGMTALINKPTNTGPLNKSNSLLCNNNSLISPVEQKNVKNAPGCV